MTDNEHPVPNEFQRWLKERLPELLRGKLMRNPLEPAEHPSTTSARLARELLALRGIEPPAQIDLGPIPDFDDDEAHAVWVRDRLTAMIAEHHAQVAPPNTAA